MTCANSVWPMYIALSGEGTPGSLADRLMAVQVGDTPNIVESRTAQGF